MDSAYREFDHKDLFKLPARRMQAGWELAHVLIECLPKDFVERSQDHSVIDALVYEVLRLYVMAQADFKIDDWPFISDPTELVRKLTTEFEIDLSDNGQVIPKEIRTAFSGENFESILDVATACGLSKEFLAELDIVRDVVSHGSFRIRREISSDHMDANARSVPSIPSYVKPSKIREVFFFYRWCLLLAHSHGLYRSESLEVYRTMKNNFLEILREKTTSMMDRRYQNFYAALASVGSFYEDQATSIEKRISELTQSWSIEFIHMDYANLLNWEKICSLKESSFLSNFVSQTLGGYLVETRLMQWQVGSHEWEKQLRNKGRIVPRLYSVLSGDDKLTQPVLFQGKLHCFPYAPIYQSELSNNPNLYFHENNRVALLNSIR